MTQQALTEGANKNLEDIESQIEQSSTFFKAKPDTEYLLHIDLDKNKMVPVENDKFKDSQGKPIKRYELIVTHVNSGRQQTWTVSKTLALQLIAELKTGKKVVKVERIGEDKSYSIPSEGSAMREMLDQYTGDFAFTKMEENERMNLEDDPIYEGEKQSFYHGRLIYKSGEQVDYYRLLERDWFVAKSNKGEDKPVLMKGWDWRENITDGHNVDRQVNGVIRLPDLSRKGYYYL